MRLRPPVTRSPRRQPTSGRQVDFVVKVRYAKTTDDGRYEAPGAKGKVGVITAYYRGMQKCPSRVN
ncbi:hypothetical protein ACFW7J_07915 [Streptomyces sp. NPDC059525]|uniref:hypothetical protein n=1 Tax=Streptomyces sp. NPDC059525 TaxID=3346857 RepID=UPI003679E3FE